MKAYNIEHRTMDGQRIRLDAEFFEKANQLFISMDDSSEEGRFQIRLSEDEARGLRDFLTDRIGDMNVKRHYDELTAKLKKIEAGTFTAKDVTTK